MTLLCLCLICSIDGTCPQSLVLNCCPTDNEKCTDSIALASHADAETTK
jgi:hypothetical protein